MPLLLRPYRIFIGGQFEKLKPVWLIENNMENLGSLKGNADRI